MDEKNIGTLSRFMGVSPHTIKYYEKIGLLASGRDEKSNYRRYQLGICTDLAECIRYRNMGFSLKELDQLKKTADSRRLKGMTDSKIKELEEEIAKKISLLDMLKTFASECERAESELGEWYIETWSQVAYCRMQTDNLTFTEENLAVGHVNLMDFAPRTMAVAVLKRSYLEGGEQKFSWGQSVSFEKNQEVFEQTPGLLRFAPRKVFVTYQKFTGAFIANGAMAERVRGVFHEYSPEFPDDAYAFRIKITHDELGDDWNYFKIVIPLNSRAKG